MPFILKLRTGATFLSPFSLSSARAGAVAKANRAITRTNRIMNTPGCCEPRAMTPQRQRPDSVHYHMQPPMHEEFDSVGLMAALKAFFGGIGFVITTPSVWPWAAVPALMMLVLASAVTVLGIWGGSELLIWIFGTNRGTWGAIGYWASWLLVMATIMVTAVIAALTLAQP